MQDNKKESWEEQLFWKYERFFGYIQEWEALLADIRKVREEATLSQLEKMEEWVEGIKRYPKYFHGESPAHQHNSGYNQALYDILAYIQKEKQLIKEK